MNVETVGKYYVANNETEEILSSGKKLQDGMVVLVGSPEQRYELHDNSTEGERYRFFTVNNWCMISDVEFWTGKNNGHTPVQVTFIGAYADGSKRPRDYDVQTPWLVKRDSISIEENELPLNQWSDDPIFNAVNGPLNQD